MLSSSAIEPAVAEVDAELVGVGIYRYRHRLDDAIAYKARLERLRDRVKAAASSGGAVTGSTNWAVKNSLAQGRKPVDEVSNPMLRAYHAHVVTISQLGFLAASPGRVRRRVRSEFNPELGLERHGGGSDRGDVVDAVAAQQPPVVDYEQQEVAALTAPQRVRLHQPGSRLMHRQNCWSGALRGACSRHVGGRGPRAGPARRDRAGSDGDLLGLSALTHERARGGEPRSYRRVQAG